MQASPLIRTRLLMEESDGGSWQHEPLSVEDPSVYLACLDALKNIGVDVRKTKPADGEGEVRDLREVREQSNTKSAFGRPLTELCAEGIDTPHGRVPCLVHRLVTALDNESTLSTEFVFRVSGAHTRVAVLKGTEYDKLDLTDVSIHDLTGLLKMFLRELPVGLLNAAYHPFVSIGRLDDPMIPRALSLACGLLPKEHRETLKYLFTFLNKVTTFSATNKMDANSLAVVFAPNILYLTQKTHKLDETKLTQDLTVSVVRTMIAHPELIGTIPADAMAAAQAMDPEEAKKRFLSHTCPRKRRNSLQKFVRLVNDAGSSVISAFTRSSTINHGVPGPATTISSTPVTSGVQPASALAPAVAVAVGEPKVTSPLATTPVLSARTLNRSQSEATSLLKSMRSPSTTSMAVPLPQQHFPLTVAPPVSLPSAPTPGGSTATGALGGTGIVRTPARSHHHHPQAPTSLKRKIGPDATPLGKTAGQHPVSHSKHRAAVVAAGTLFDPRHMASGPGPARAKESAPVPVGQALKEIAKNENFDTTNESPSKRFRNAAALQTKKEADVLDTVSGETPRTQRSSSERRLSLQGVASPSSIRRLSLNASGEQEHFVDADGENEAVFGFTSTPQPKRKASHAPLTGHPASADRPKRHHSHGRERHGEAAPASSTTTTSNPSNPPRSRKSISGAGAAPRPTSRDSSVCDCSWV
eukprot:m.232371 g.232371  ORF g.232371 m.232371 type:complete len:698 (-) comp18690_c0_seq1:24-2117(-)